MSIQIETAYQAICHPALGHDNQEILQCKQPLRTSPQSEEKGQHKQLCDLLFPQQRMNPMFARAINRQWLNCEKS